MAGIYVHIPFCKSKCTYCDFASYPKEIDKIDAYFACLYKEIKARSLQLKDYVFDTVYIGGGTPSFVHEKYIVGLLKRIKETLNLTESPEITIEINPKTLSEEKFKAYKKAGINRFSVGLQAGDDEELKRLNRIHTAKDFLETCKILKGENLSADVLIGLHNQTNDDLKKTLTLAISGGVKHISMYALTVEPCTPIYTDYLNGELPSDDEVRDLYDFGVNFLKENGFFRYEVSNFAQNGYRSKHNLNYWKRGEYIGFGVAASSFIGERRFTNSFSITEYINAIILGKFPEIASDDIGKEDAEFEKIMLALRTADGLNVNEFNVKFKEDFKEKYKIPLEKNKDYLIFAGDTLKIKDEYLFVQNSILTDFLK